MMRIGPCVVCGDRDEEGRVRGRVIAVVVVCLLIMVAVGFWWLGQNWFGGSGGTFDAWLQARASLYGGGLGVLGGIIGGVAGGFVGGWLALRASKEAVERQVAEAAKERVRQAAAVAEERARDAAQHRLGALRALQSECRLLAALLDPEVESIFASVTTIPREPFMLMALPAAQPFLTSDDTNQGLSAFTATVAAQHTLLRLNGLIVHTIAEAGAALRGPTRSGLERDLLDRVRTEAGWASEALKKVDQALDALLPR
jgi:hypothetical protein